MKAHKIEPIKRLVKKATGVGIPTREEALANVRDRNPLRMKFGDDGYIPNNPKLPLLYYRKAFRFSRKELEVAGKQRIASIVWLFRLVEQRVVEFRVA
jgi:hypothetical protein